jgi:hypothetical protein
MFAIRRHRARLTALLLLACGVGFVRPAAAHGPAPSALSVVDEDGSGPTLVRLSGGLALRKAPGRYDFVCPAAWNDEVVLPAARIPGGPTVIAGSSGLYVIDAEGRVAAHPDPLAAGLSIDFAVIGDALLALRIVMGRTELLEVGPTSVRVLFSEPGAWTSIAATRDAIGLQRVNAQRVEQLRLTRDGRELDRASAPVPAPPILVFARATSSAFYSVLATPRGRELGQIEPDRWISLELAVGSIGGPVDAADGAPIAAIDTELVRLPEPRAVLVGGGVNCVGRLDRELYACTREGLSSIAGSGLGEPIFALSSLAPPDLELLSSERRDACQLQWEHFRFDLLALGVPLSDPPETPPAQLEADAGAERDRADPVRRERAASDEGCRVTPAGSARVWPVLVALAWVRRRSAKSRERLRQERA